MTFNTLADAVKTLGEARTLRFVNAHAKNVAYRKQRQDRVKADQAEAKAILARVKSDPRFADLMNAPKLRKASGQ